MKWEYLRQEEFKDAIKTSGGLCVMCLGCLEKHGEHLPVGTDSLKGDKIVELAAEKAGVMMFPTSMWLGDVSSSHIFENPGENEKYGFIGISPKTLLIILEELCDEIARNGFNKILLCTSHGGNSGLVSLFHRAQFYKKKKYATLYCKAYDFGEQLQPANMLKVAKENPDYLPMLTEEDLETLAKFAETGTGGGHGDFRETMLVYGTYPELVAPERFEAVDGSNQGKLNFPKGSGVSSYASWIANYPNVLSGYPSTGCTKTIGEAAVKMSVDRLADIFTQLKNDNTAVEIMEEYYTK